MVSNREKRYDDLRIIYSVSQNGFWLQSSTSYTLVLTLKVVIQMNYIKRKMFKLKFIEESY